MTTMSAAEVAKTPRAAQRNIDTIIELEEEFQGQRSFATRIADAIAGLAGTVRFVVAHLVWFGAWVAINRGLAPGVPAFDPYPFQLLCMLVSLEGVLLSTFVLIKQNRMSQRADQRAHLDLQVNLLSEKEVTKVLQMLQRISRRLEIDESLNDPEIVELAEATAVDNLARDLNRRLPEE